MDNTVRIALKEILAVEGVAVCRDPGRCESLLRGRCEGQRREILWLIGALREGVVPELLDVRTDEPVESCVVRLSARLKNDLALREDAARWAVESWAGAMDLLTAQSVDATPIRDEPVSIEFYCPACRHTNHADREGQVSCEGCGWLSQIDPEGKVSPIPEVMETHCPRCGWCEQPDCGGEIKCHECSLIFEFDDRGKIISPVIEVNCPTGCDGFTVYRKGRFHCPTCCTAGCVEQDDEGIWSVSAHFITNCPIEYECPGCGEESTAILPGPVKCECGSEFDVDSEGRTNELPLA